MKNQQQQNEKPKFKIKIAHKGWWITALIVAVLAYLAFKGANLYLNYINIYEIGQNFINIYLKDIKMNLTVCSFAFLIAVVFIVATNLVLKRNLLKWEGTAVYLSNKPLFLIMTAVLGLIAVYLLPYGMAQSALIASKPTWFLHGDPIYGKNIGYYVFQRPFFMNVTTWFISLTVFMLIYSVFIYFIYYVRNGGGPLSQILKQNGIVTHLAVNVLIVFALSALSLNFAAEELLFTAKNDMVGGKYTDMMVWANYYKIAPYILIVIVLTAIVLIVKKRPKPLIGTVLTYPALWFVVMICSVVVQNFIVRPNEASIERAYIKNNIEYTNRAYNLTDVTEVEYPITGTVTEEALKASTDEISNIRVADYNATLTAYNQMQTFSNNYQFKNVDVLPYEENGKKKSAFISVRETNVDSKSIQPDAYINSKMKYTHGYGVVMSSISETTPDGQPKYLMKDMDNDSAAAPLKITQPRVYFGETDKSYTIVNSLQKEMDFYDSKNEKEYSYEGSAGVPLNFFNRMLYACKYGDINLAISGYITKDSRILSNRNVIERAKLAIPFLDYDEDAQIAVTGDGRLVWLVDAYTTTNYYPYSQRIYNIDKEFGTNYIRNSVKLVIDAYNGDITAYVMDWNDPIIQSYNATYPGVFSSEPFPVDLAPQIKYPRKLFEIQANIYKRYHNTNPLTFYSKSDVWEVAKEKYGENSEMRLIEPYYSVMKDLKQDPQMMIMLPYTMADKDSNLTAWFAASSDIEDYGRLMTYMFPKGKHVYGTLQIENKIDNDPVIAKELTAMKNDTSTVMRGNMMVVPIMGTIVYVEPIYVTPQGRASLPEMKKVILVCGDSIVMENSLSAGFRRMLELKPESDYDSPISEITPPSSNIPTELSEKMSQAIAKYNEAKQFSKENDWVNYGRTMKEFEEQLAEVDKSLQEILPEPTEEATPAPEETAEPTPSASGESQ